MNKYLLVSLFLLQYSIHFGQSNYEFQINLITGENKKFSSYLSDGPVLINFWALWCKPCRMEIKALNELYKRYNANGLKIIGINQDTPRSEAKVKSFVAGYEIGYDVALDPNKKIFELFNGQAIPLSILFNKDGEIVFKHTGYFLGDEFEIEEQIKKFLEIE